MIFRELDAVDWQDQSVVARRTPDGQMPYYLRRFFGDNNQADVLRHRPGLNCRPTDLAGRLAGGS